MSGTREFRTRVQFTKPQALLLLGIVNDAIIDAADKTETELELLEIVRRRLVNGLDWLEEKRKEPAHVRRGKSPDKSSDEEVPGLD